VKKNLPESPLSKTTVHGHQWGVFDTPFAQTHEKYYTHILAADCLWMPHEHSNLARSMLYFLSDEPEARVHVIAGFHTGRAKMAPFFDTVREEGLDFEEIYEMDADGVKREWAVERDGGREDITGRKKWLTIACLRRQGTLYERSK
jgi:EEF1A N-terminal glycine/lysine methyltransferase